MDKIIQFPNRILKELRDKKNPGNGPEIEVNSEELQKPVYTCIPVKFSEKSRYDEYFLITYQNETQYVYDTTEYIKVDQKEPLNESKWIVPEKGKSMSRFEANNLVAYSKKYLFLHSAYRKNYINLAANDPENFIKKYMRHLGELPMTVQVTVRDGYKISLNTDRANELGLMLSRGYTDRLIVRDLSTIHPFNPYKAGLFAKAINHETGQIKYLESMMLDEGIDEKVMGGLNSISNVLFFENKRYPETTIDLDKMFEEKYLEKEALNAKEKT